MKERHGDDYKIYNLSGIPYDYSKLGNNVNYKLNAKGFRFSLGRSLLSSNKYIISSLLEHGRIFIK
jgi:hypothetical protein